MRNVWRLGDPGGGLGRFRGTGLVTPGDDEAVIDVARPDADSQVPAYHPGPLAAYAGGCDKRLVLGFDLPGRLGDCLLTLRMFAVQGPVPDLMVEVNGRRGLYFPVVERTDRRGVPGVSAISGWIDLALRLDAGWLLEGRNEIALTTTSAEPLEPIGPAHPELGYLWGSALQHAVIRLDELADGDEIPARAPSVDLRPLPLYVDAADGLAELADLVLSTPGPFDQGEAVVEIGSDRIRTPLDLEGREHGEVRVRLEVPEQDAPVPARIVVRLDGCELVHETTFRPCRKWTLHLLPHVHLDLGYTDFQAKVAEIHTRNVDRVLDILDRQPDYAYSIDGSYVVQQFLRTRSPAAVERLRSAIAEGQVSVNAFFALFLTGLATLEECFRAGVHAAALRREFDFPVDYANLTDVPSYSGALPTVLRAMGIDAFLGIQNHGRAANDDSDELHLRSPFRWRGPDGAEVLTFFSDCYAQLRYFCGFPVSIEGSAQSLSRLLDRYERDDYVPADLPVVGIYSDNEDLADGEAELVDRWAKRYAWPKLRFSTVRDYFAAVRPLTDRLPLVQGDGGSYWEDGVGAGAAIIAEYRRAQTGLASAEGLGALLGAVDGSLRPSFEDLDPAWDCVLIGCEHTWTSMHAPRHPHGEQTVDQLAWKAHQIAHARRVAKDETRRVLSQLGERVTTHGPTLLVANTLGWTRDVETEVELPPGRQVAARGGVVVDEAHEHDGIVRVRLRVGDVPGFGYRALPLTARGTSPPPPARTDARSPTGAQRRDVETAQYRLRVERGRITSLWSKSLDRELLDAGARFALGEVVYVRGGGGAQRTSLFDRDPSLPLPDLEEVPAHMELDDVAVSATGTVVRLRGTGPSMPTVQVEVRLRDHDDRVDVAVRLHKEAVYDKESVYVAFPFAVAGATARYDRQVGWVDPVRDHLPGAANEWFTTLFGVGLANDEVALTWTSADAPLFTLGDVVRGRWPNAAEAADGTILSWIMNNYWWTNFPPAQEGPFEARYAFRPAASWDPAAAARFGREVRVEPCVAVLGWMDKFDTAVRPLPEDGASLLDVRAPDHVVPTVVAARRRAGLLVRLQETVGEAGTVAIRHPRAAGGAAELVSALEEDPRPLPLGADRLVTVDVGPYQVVSVRLTWDS